MTPEKREARIARFEAWGIDRVKADLANGGHALVGGTLKVRELAHEWVRMKEAEAMEGEEIFLLKPSLYGVGIDVKAAKRKIARAIKTWRGQ